MDVSPCLNMLAWEHTVSWCTKKLHPYPEWRSHYLRLSHPLFPDTLGSHRSILIPLLHTQHFKWVKRMAGHLQETFPSKIGLFLKINPQGPFLGSLRLRIRWLSLPEMKALLLFFPPCRDQKQTHVVRSSCWLGLTSIAPSLSSKT